MMRPGDHDPRVMVPDFRNPRLKEENMNTRILVHRALAGLALAALLPFAAWAGPVDINTADAATLARELKGIGPSKAKAIVEYRQKNGPFKNADELTQVKGIAARVVEANRANIRVDKADKANAAAAVAQEKGGKAKDKGATRSNPATKDE
jgi:competence protein ComEA